MEINPTRRRLLAGATALGLAAPFLWPRAVRAEAGAPIRFAAGPFLPTPDDTKREWEPLFRHLAERLGRPHTLVATSDWAGISVALASNQVDVAFVGPWGYVLAKREGRVVPLAVSVVNGSPTYRAIIVARKGLNIAKWPDDAKGMRISFADVGSTSGWLIPSYWFKTQGIDPKTYFQYREGATHAANETAVAHGQVDLATDNDRIRLTLIQRGVIKEEDSTVVWSSDPIPNSLMAARADLDPNVRSTITRVLTEMTEAEAARLMPKNFTGWAPTSDTEYEVFEKAGMALGILQPTKG